MSRRLRLGFLTVFAALCAISLTFLVLYTFSQPGLRFRIDLSSTPTRGLSQRTISGLKSLPEDSQLTAFLFREDPSNQWFGSTVYDQSFQLLRGLVDNAEVQSAGHLKTLILDPSSPLVAREREINRLDRQSGETLVLEGGGQRRVLSFEDLFQILRATPDGNPARILKQRVESALGDAAISLAAGKRMQVAVVTGYGEGSLETPQQLKPLQGQLQRENWEVSAVHGPEDAKNADLLIVPGQRQPFLPSDAKAMEQWLQQDRPLLLALGPNAPDDVVSFWNRLLHNRGTGFGDGLVCEPLKIMGELLTGRSENAQLEIGTEQLSAQHPITVPLIEAGRYLLFAGARPVLFESGTNDYSQERLLRSKSLAWIENVRGKLFIRDDGEPLGVVPLGVAVERWAPGAAGLLGRLVILGSAECLRSGLVYNRELLAGALQWLGGAQESDRGLVSLGERPFRPQREVMARIHNISVFGIPGVTFLIGFWIFWRRKR